MIIFLYGKDNFRSRQKLNEIVEHYKKIHKQGLGLKRFGNGLMKKNQTSFQDFRDELRTPSLFKKKKLIILIDVLEDPRFKQEFLEEKKLFKETSDVILFYEGNLPKKTNALFQFLKKKAKSQEFALLKGKMLNDWIKEEFKKNGCQIEDNAKMALLQSVGEDDPYRLYNEIKKLSAFRLNERVKLADVELLVKKKIDADIFKTIDSLASGNKKQAISLFHKHLEKGESPFYLFSMIAFQFRNLLIIKDLVKRGYDFGSVLKKSGLHPFVARKSFFYAKNFEIGQLKKIYQKLFEIDLEMKKGQIAPETALDVMIAEI